MCLIIIIIDRVSGLLSKKNSKRTYFVIKRIQDVVLSIVALLIAWPLMAIIAIIIVLDSPGAGPIFVQTRGGKNGKPFRFFKFRTMYPGADSQLEALLPLNEMDGPVFKIKNDPRITAFGRFLRRSGLDELPQLWSVLRGEMSLVGPRPAELTEIEQFGDYEKQKLSMIPGMSCYWQIQPNRNELPFSQWIALDIAYIRQCGFWTDWYIILKTFGAMAGMNGI